MVTAPRHPHRKTKLPPTEVSVAQSPYSPSVQSLLDHPPASLPVYLMLGGTVFTILFLIWAWVGQVDEVARAPGKLVPKGEVHKIHPVELGKVARIAVKEGQTVQAGEVLAALDTDLAAKEVERLEQALESARIELEQTRSLLDRTRLQTEARTAIARSEILAQDVAIQQSQNTVDNQTALLAQLQQDATAQKLRLKRLQPLMDQGALSQDVLFDVEQRLRDRQRSITETEGTVQKLHSDRDRLQVELTQKQTAAKEAELEAQQQIEQLQVKLTELQAKVNETQVLLEAARAKVAQSVLAAPVPGVVLTLNVKQSGEVVQPGQTIAEIAPEGKPLVLSASLPSRDAGFVKVGMPVQIKFDAYPYQDYGIFPGKVVNLSSDSKTVENLGQIYRVEVALDRTVVRDLGQTIPLKPGQTAIAEIVTRRRRMIDVLLDPIKKLQGGITL